MKKQLKEKFMKENKETMKFTTEEPRLAQQYTETFKSGTDYVLYGSNNKFPQYIYQLYLNSSILQSICNGIADYTYGNGFVFAGLLDSIKNTINDDGDTAEDVIKRCMLDYAIFGGFTYQVINDRTDKPSQIVWLDFTKCRKSEDEKTIYYSEKFGQWGAKTIPYPVYTKDTKEKTSIVYFKGHKTRGIYPVPMYIGALNAIETSIEIGKFHLNNIQKNFNVNTIISFNNGVPDETKQEEIVQKITDKFAGTTADSNFLVNFNENKDQAVTVDRLQGDDFDKKYEALTKSTMQEIFVAFRATPALFGINPENTGFSKQEYLDSFQLYNKTMILPIQQDFERMFGHVFGEGSLTIIPFSLEATV